MSTFHICEAVGNIFVDILDVIDPLTSTGFICKQQELNDVSHHEEAADIITLIVLLVLAHLAHKFACENRIIKALEPTQSLEHLGRAVHKALLAGEGHGTEVIGVLGVN